VSKHCAFNHHNVRWESAPPYDEELELGLVYNDPGAAATDINVVTGATDILTENIVKKVYPTGNVDTSTVKTKTDAAGKVVEKVGGIGTLYEVEYEVTDPAGCTIYDVGLPAERTECNGLTTKALRLVKIVQSKKCMVCVAVNGVDKCVQKFYDKNGVYTQEALCPDKQEMDADEYTVKTFSLNSACSTNGLCISLGETEVEVVKEKVTPVLTLFGLSAVTILEGAPYTLCAPGATATVVCDRGLDEASDTVTNATAFEADGITPVTTTVFRSRAGRPEQGRVLNKFTRVCGTTLTIDDVTSGAVSYSLADLCRFDTSVVGTFPVTFSFTNDDSLTGEVTRTIAVLKDCNYKQEGNTDLFESVCITDATLCSKNGLCVVDLSRAVHVEPS
jgi:hypothetical protein